VLDQGFNEASTGTAQLWLKVLVLECRERVNEKLEQLSRVMYFPITAKTADRLMQHLRTLGFDGDSFEDLDPRRVGHHSFVGQEIELACRHEEDRNKTLCERWEFPGTSRPLDEQKLRKLNQFLTKKADK
jgi:hypothetical protein